MSTSIHNIRRQATECCCCCCWRYWTAAQQQHVINTAIDHWNLRRNAPCTRANIYNTFVGLQHLFQKDFPNQIEDKIFIGMLSSMAEMISCNNYNNQTDKLSSEHGCCNIRRCHWRKFKITPSRLVHWALSTGEGKFRPTPSLSYEVSWLIVLKLKLVDETMSRGQIPQNVKFWVRIGIGIVSQTWSTFYGTNYVRQCQCSSIILSTNTFCMGVVRRHRSIARLSGPGAEKPENVCGIMTSHDVIVKFKGCVHYVRRYGCRVNFLTAQRQQQVLPPSFCPLSISSLCDAASNVNSNSCSLLGNWATLRMRMASCYLQTAIRGAPEQ